MEPKRKNKCVESVIQKAFFQWLKLQYPLVRRVTFAIPNGAKRTPAEGANQRALGLTAGIPDIFMSIAAQEYHGLYIEMKSKDGALTYNQIDAIESLKKEGYKCVVCHSVTEAIDLVKDYLKDTPHVRPQSAQTTHYSPNSIRTWPSQCRSGGAYDGNLCSRI